MNFASPSGWERFLWGPFALVLTVLCFLVARSGPDDTPFPVTVIGGTA